MTHLQILQRFLRDQRGATAVEYSMICALIIFVIMATVQGLANQTNIMWTKIGTTMQQATA